MGVYDGLARFEVNYHIYFFSNSLPRVLVNYPCSELCHSVAQLKINYIVYSMSTNVASIDVHCLDGLCVTLAQFKQHCPCSLRLSFD